LTKTTNEAAGETAPRLLTGARIAALKGPEAGDQRQDFGVRLSRHRDLGKKIAILGKVSFRNHRYAPAENELICTCKVK
jgi:hypothetical protein